MPDRLKLLHNLQGFFYFRVICIHESERSDVHGVVFEIFQVERLEVLQQFSCLILQKLAFGLGRDLIAPFFELSLFASCSDIKFQLLLPSRLGRR